jgi:CRISPR-associated protein Cas1
MVKRSLFFGNPYHLGTEKEQLTITDKSTAEQRTVPIEDLGFVVLEHPQITFSQKLMQKFAEHNVAVVFCNEKYLPASLLLHLDTHHVQAERFRHQLGASEPLKKQLWQQTIKEKIQNQAEVLRLSGLDSKFLEVMIPRVQSGDVGNQEGQAARVYWRMLFGQEFTREREGEAPNAFLNYGYAIIRAGVARALAGAGLLPTLGIHHRNKYNHYALADDIMEPYRPFVDRLVWQRMQLDSFSGVLEKDDKAAFLGLLASDTVMGKETSPMMIAMQHTAQSLAKAFAGETRKLKYPTLAV